LVQFLDVAERGEDVFAFCHIVEELKMVVVCEERDVLKMVGDELESHR